MDELPLTAPESLFAALCRPFLDALPVDGASMSLFGSPSVQLVGYASNDTARRIDELQFDLGEGPRWVAADSREPVLLPDLTAADHSRWPFFGTAVQSLDVRELFVYPLSVNALFLGIVALHSREETGFPTHQATASRLVAGTASVLERELPALASGIGADLLHADPKSWGREIYQATGMVLAQTRTSVSDALLLLKAHAFANDLTLSETAHAVLARHVDFSTHLR
ncbi:GAF domain-containing protein [Arthrobacter sp. MDT1-65]